VGGRVIFLRRFLIVLVTTVIAMALAYAFSHKQSPRKVATATLVFGQPRPDMQVVSNGFSTGDQSSQLVPNTNASLVSADDIARATASKLGMNPTDVRNDVSVSAEQNSDVVDVKASRPTAAEAAQLANTYVNVYVSRASTLERKRAQDVLQALRAQLKGVRQATTTTNSLGSSSSASADQLRGAIAAESALARVGSGSPTIAQTASPTDTASSPKTTRNVLFGALFGLVLGIGIAGLAGGSRNDPPYRDEFAPGPDGDRGRRRTPVGV
jgi:capsular polysaccharide biosynthesis protein